MGAGGCGPGALSAGESGSAAPFIPDTIARSAQAAIDRTALGDPAPQGARRWAARAGLARASPAPCPLPPRWRPRSGFPVCTAGEGGGRMGGEFCFEFERTLGGKILSSAGALRASARRDGGRARAAPGQAPGKFSASRPGCLDAGPGLPRPLEPRLPPGRPASSTPS